MVVENTLIINMNILIKFLFFHFHKLFSPYATFDKVLII